MCVQEDPTGQKYGRLEEEGGMGPDKVNQQPLAPLKNPPLTFIELTPIETLNSPLTTPLISPLTI